MGLERLKGGGQAGVAASVWRNSVLWAAGSGPRMKLGPERAE